MTDKLETSAEKFRPFMVDVINSARIVLEPGYIIRETWKKSNQENPKPSIISRGIILAAAATVELTKSYMYFSSGYQLYNVISR